MYHRYREPACAPLLNPLAVVTLRSFHRGRERIRGTLLNDCLLGTCCFCCAMCQIDRDMKHCEKIRGYVDV
ncbi:hypothetical protein P879_05525 [Paragonimus westermani]|uniref:Uncharacterized protein n=1 Tax=Paragonimus westermani TaxID=34504 RepID=A0A8T0DKP0_9TREM|nr:hypothetical protein P879_05525 [Paragonimus westermani]